MSFSSFFTPITFEKTSEMDAKIIQAIDGAAIAFAQEYISQRKEKLIKRKSVATGDLLNSLKVQALKQSAEEAASLLISFTDEGRLIDMRQKSISYGRKTLGEEGMTQLVDWMETKNGDKFIAKWKEAHANSKITDRTKILNAIAWGIAINRTKGKFRRKVWWNKSKTAMIGNLYNEVAASMLAPMAENILESLPKN